MTTGLEHVDSGALRSLILNVKTALERAVDTFEPQTFHISIGTLQTLETEARRRGLDPTAPEFGFDWLGEIAQIKVELMMEEQND